MLGRGEAKFQVVPEAKGNGLCYPEFLLEIGGRNSESVDARLRKANDFSAR